MVTNGSKKFGCINGVALLSRQAQIPLLEGHNVKINTLYSKFAFLEQLFSLINNRNVDISYSNRRKLLKISLQYIKHKNRLRVLGQ